MSQIDYTSMSDRELKQYFLEHRDDIQAFHAYMDRRRARPHQDPIVAADEVDFSFTEQMKLIDERMRSRGAQRQSRSRFKEIQSI